MNITIKKIAELADVSRGTVDRVIHNRPGVKDDVKERINNILKAYDYKPNIAGKALVSANKNIKIGVVLSPDYNPFIEEVKRGVRDEARRISTYGVELDVEIVSNYDENKQLEVLNRLQEHEVSAVAVVPVEKPVIERKINELNEAGIPVVTFNSDISETARLAHVGQDNFKAGRTVGGLALKLLREPASVGIITSTTNLTCHTRRMEGFKTQLSKRPGIEIAAIEQNDDMDEPAYRITKEYIQQYKNLQLIYLTGGGAGGVGRALEETGKAGTVRLICHDLVPDCVRLLREGIIDFVIGQNPHMQGSLPIRILFDYIFLKERPEQTIVNTSVDIFTGDNIE